MRIRVHHQKTFCTSTNQHCLPRGKKFKSHLLRAWTHPVLAAVGRWPSTTSMLMRWDGAVGQFDLQASWAETFPLSRNLSRFDRVAAPLFPVWIDARCPFPPFFLFVSPLQCRTSLPWNPDELQNPSSSCCATAHGVHGSVTVVQNSTRHNRRQSAWCLVRRVRGDARPIDVVD